MISLIVACRAALDLEPEGTEPQPHLTVARRAPADLADVLGARFADGRPAWRAEELVLFRSHLGPPRSRYEVLGRWPFEDHVM
jgi:2'-5' RNA ligase